MERIRWTPTMRQQTMSDRVLSVRLLDISETAGVKARNEGQSLYDYLLCMDKDQITERRGGYERGRPWLISPLRPILDCDVYYGS